MKKSSDFLLIASVLSFLLSFSFCGSTLIAESLSSNLDAPPQNYQAFKNNSFGTSVCQDDEKTSQPFTVKVPDGGIQFTVSGNWKEVKPSNNIIDVEIKIPKLETDQQDGRLTISGARGTIEANIARWEGQFSSKSAKPKNETKTIANLKVHLVDLVGTYVDAPGGPFSGRPTVQRENYRMLGAIIETPAKGNYFVKFYGPKEVIDQNEKEFKSMIDSLELIE